MARSLITRGIVLKRSNLGETDRLVTLLSQDLGKVQCLAKGIRKLQSSNRANLEPGNQVKFFLIQTKSLPLLTQSQLLQDAQQLRQSLTGIRQLSEILEIFDRLFVEDFIEEESFQLAENIYHELLNPAKRNLRIKNQLDLLLQNLGYQKLEESGFNTISDYVAALSEKKLHSYAFLEFKTPTLR
jgi:DNA repair protein RecO